MSKLSFNQALCAAYEDGQPAATSGGNIGVVPPSCQIVLPNHFLNVGRTIRLTVSGSMSTIGAQVFSPNFIVLVGSGGANALFSLGATGNVVINTIAKQNVPFTLSGIFTVRTVSTSISTAYGIFKLRSEAIKFSQVPTVGGISCYLQPDGATAVSANFSYDLAIQLNLTLAMNNFSAATVKQYLVEALN